MDELVGVGFLYLDGLNFLLDVKDTLPLTGYAGKNALMGVGKKQQKQQQLKNAKNNGVESKQEQLRQQNQNKDVCQALLRVHVRCWIDAVEAVPPYITLDCERRLEEFIGRNCIMVFYFPGLLAMDPIRCASTYISFKVTPLLVRTSISPLTNPTICPPQQPLTYLSPVTTPHLKYLSPLANLPPNKPPSHNPSPPSLPIRTIEWNQFFYHAIHYRTPRFGGISCNPELGASVRIEQVTPLVLSYISSLHMHPYSPMTHLCSHRHLPIHPSDSGH